MKNALIMITVFMFGGTLSAQTGRVTVNITDIVAEWGGTVRIGLFKEKGFPKAGKAIASIDVPVRDIKTTASFENILLGQYAIAVYQDVNLDGKLNRTIYGEPTEPYAFSNNVFGRFGPPKFEKVTFKLESTEHTNLVIRLKD